MAVLVLSLLICFTFSENEKVEHLWWVETSPVKKLHHPSYGEITLFTCKIFKFEKHMHSNMRESFP